MNPFSPNLRPPVEYPDSDGVPMESDIHRDLMCELVATYRDHVRDHSPPIYVAGNLFIYYVEGEPRNSVGPDLFIVRGVPSHPRRVYKVWEEGKGPELVIELSSESTFRHDLKGKKALYERLGVLEYYVFDPLECCFTPRFRGFRRDGAELVEHEGRCLDDGTIVFSSELTGLELHGRGESLRWVDPATCEVLPDREDIARREREATLRAEKAVRRAADLAAENERLRRELERRQRDA